ncbi:kinesin-like protein KIF20A isoform X2 [Ischnura elegans]|uniref:kinesin-like protein KIF20A isoform X2 n=1 Tax=Ischnura elegans TaxID=197161 RepID=UPI001ED8ABAA|nr:kinesin-like protein KIF20A isoform X2 [Ischnura elegans]
MAQNSLHKFSFDESDGRFRRGVVVPSKVRKNLCDLLPEEEGPSIGHVKVYLRIKPLLKGEKASIQMKNEHMLIAYPPEDYSCKSIKSKASTSYGYKFSRIYGPETSQKEMFEGTLLPIVNDFLKGKDGLLFAYGTTSAGKTFTIQGNEKNPGIIPRTLDLLFNSLDGKIMSGIKYKPTSNYGVEILSDEVAESEAHLKEMILKWNPNTFMEGSLYIQSVFEDTRSTQSSVGDSSGMPSIMNGTFFIPENLKRERNSIFLPADDQEVKYSVWVSFAEIYNECVYDLLEFLPGKGPNMKRSKLNLVTDYSGNTYIKGLQEVCVTSGDEACQVMLFGKCNLHFASTKLNHKSSRSHCVFTVKLLRMCKDDGSSFQISTLSFCDLAGSERVEKSGNVGERLKETGNINTSLLVLGRCFKSLRNNHDDSKNLERVPFRESKLTRIFQNSLTGNGNVAMIVNVSQSSLLFEETLNVLKYAAVAQEIVIMPAKVPQPRLNVTKSRFSILASKHQRSQWKDSVVVLEPAGGALAAPENETQKLNKEIENLQDEVLDLKAQLEDAKRECYIRADQVRQHLCSKYKEMIDRMKSRYESNEKDIRSDLEEYYTCKIEIINERYETKIKKLEMRIKSLEEGEEEVEVVKSSLPQNEEPLVEEIHDEEPQVKESNDLEPEAEEIHYEKLQAEELHNEENVSDCLQSKIDELNKENEDMKGEIEKLNAQLRQMEDNHASDVLQKDEENSLLRNENSSLKAKEESLEAKIKELEETLQDGYVEFSSLTDTLTNLEKELNDKNQIIARMEFHIAQLKDEVEVSDKLIHKSAWELEKKDNIILNLEKELQAKELGISVDIQCDLSLEEHIKEKESLEKALADMEMKLKNTETYYEKIMRSKDNDLTNQEKSFKSLLNQKNMLEDRVLTLESENSHMSSRIISVERELTESNKIVREVCIGRNESKRSQADDSEARNETLQMLALLKEELELKRQDNERLLNETQCLRDAVDCKEKELQSFQENQVKTLRKYETLLNKAREEVDLHKREERQLRALLQIGTPNKYEKKCESLNDELTKLKKTLNAVLCEECSERVPLDDHERRSFRDKSDISNENMDPRSRHSRSRRRRSKSYTMGHYSFDDSDDSDFMVEKENARRRKVKPNKTVTGHEMNEASARSQSMEKTPFKTSRRLMNPSDCLALSDLTDNMPLFPRTPADVIKRVLRPRRK